MGNRSQNRAIDVEGLVNIRDLGGLERTDGSHTPFGVFFRSENVDALTDAGWEQLRDAGVRTVVDLRRTYERALDRRSRPAWIATIDIDLDGEDNDAFWNGYWDNGLVGTAEYFLPHLAAMPERSVSALSAIVDAPSGAVLFHCAGGRDRTGLMAALLLTAADVVPDQIVDDYMETIRLGPARSVAYPEQRIDEAAIESFLNARGTTTEGSFRAALEGLDLGVLLDAGRMSTTSRSRLTSWRGTLAATSSAEEQPRTASA